MAAGTCTSPTPAAKPNAIRKAEHYAYQLESVGPADLRNTNINPATAPTISAIAHLAIRGANEGLARANALAVSPDDQHLYVAGENDDMIAVFMRDAIAPALPTPIESSSHVPGVWSNDPTVDVSWPAAVDNPGGSGLAGYSIVWTRRR